MLKFSGLSYLRYSNNLANFYQILRWVMSKPENFCTTWCGMTPLFFQVYADIFNHIQYYEDLFKNTETLLLRHTQAYSAICVTVTYHNLVIFWALTRPLLRSKIFYCVKTFKTTCHLSRCSIQNAVNLEKYLINVPFFVIPHTYPYFLE